MRRRHFTSRLIRIYTVCHFGFGVLIDTLSATMDMSTIKDKWVYFVNSFGAKFQTTFAVSFIYLFLFLFFFFFLFCFCFFCFFVFLLLLLLLFFILTNFRLERRLYVKLKDWMSNSVDPDETAHWAVSSGSMLFAKAYYYRLWQWKS